MGEAKNEENQQTAKKTQQNFQMDNVEENPRRSLRLIQMTFRLALTTQFMNPSGCMFLLMYALDTKK